MKGNFALYWDNQETGRWDAYISLTSTSGRKLGAVRIEGHLPPDCRQCRANPDRVIAIFNRLHYWLVPPSFLNTASRLAKGRTEQDPAKLTLPPVDFQHFGFVSGDGVIQESAVQALVRMVGGAGERIPAYGMLYDFIGRGYSVQEAADLVEKSPDRLFESQAQVKDSEGVRFYEAIKPDEWADSQPSKEEIERHIRLVTHWIRRDPNDRGALYGSLDAHRLGIVDRQGRVNADRVRRIRDFILDHSDQEASFDRLLQGIGETRNFEPGPAKRPAPKGKAAQKLKKLNRQKGKVKKRRR